MTTITARNSDGYEAPAGLAVDPVVFTVIDGQLHVLLVRSGEKHALPGGFVSPSQSPEDAVHSHLEAKTGVAEVYLEQLRTYADPGRDQRGWIPSIAYIGLVEPSRLTETGEGEWFSDLPDLMYDHKTIVQHAIERIKGKVWTSNITRALLPDEFALREIRTVIEAIIGENVDPSNFIRDFPKTGLVEKSGGKITAGGRPAAAYRFVSNEMMWAETRR